MESLSNYYDSIPATSKQTARHVAGSAMWSPDILVSPDMHAHCTMLCTLQLKHVCSYTVCSGCMGILQSRSKLLNVFVNAELV